MIDEQSGWVKLHRKSLNSVWSNKPLISAFAHYCMKRAYWKPSKIYWNGTERELKPGQFYTGRFKLSRETGLSQQNIRTAIQLLTKINFLTIESTNKGSIITLLNYIFYQSNEGEQPTDQPATNQQPTSNQPATNQQPTTDEEVKKLRSKEVKNTTAVLHFEGRKIKIPLITHSDFESKYPGIILSDEYGKMDDWLFDHPEKKIKNHSQFARNWLNKTKVEIKQEFGSTIPLMKARD
jgi:hypothetical protein